MIKKIKLDKRISIESSIAKASIISNEKILKAVKEIKI